VVSFHLLFSVTALSTVVSAHCGVVISVHSVFTVQSLVIPNVSVIFLAIYHASVAQFSIDCFSDSLFCATSENHDTIFIGLNTHPSKDALPHSNKSFHSGFSFTVISAALVTRFCSHSSNHSSNEDWTYFLDALDTISSNGFF
jgi:hypothetical protein